MGVWQVSNVRGKSIANVTMPNPASAEDMFKEEVINGECGYCFLPCSS